MADLYRVSVVGGGIGGLVAAITAADRGAPVTLYAKRIRSSGGRWRMNRRHLCPCTKVRT